ncbi:2632_t:CDS:2, partial [Racocetra fulgida]
MMNKKNFGREKEHVPDVRMTNEDPKGYGLEIDEKTVEIYDDNVVYN